MADVAPCTGEDIDARVVAFARGLIDRAAGVAGEPGPEQRYALAGLGLALATNGGTYRERLTRALRHSRVTGPSAEPALRVFALDGGAPGCEQPPGWPFPYAERRHLERLHVTADRNVYVTFSDETLTWHVFERESGRAAIWTANAACLPDWEYSFPMRILLNWLFAPTATTLAHAAVVGDGERGVLLAGAGGAGKSTTAMACLEAGLGTCGDDFVAVSCRGEPRAYTLFDTVKLDEASLARFPGLAGEVANRDAPADTKARIHLSGPRADRLLRSCPIDALLVPRVTPGAGTCIEPLSKGEGLRALAPTTLFLVRGTEAETAAKLAALVRRLPTYTLRIGGEPAAAASAIQAFLKRGDA